MENNNHTTIHSNDGKVRMLVTGHLKPIKNAIEPAANKGIVIRYNVGSADENSIVMQFGNDKDGDFVCVRINSNTSVDHMEKVYFNGGRTDG